MESGGYDPRVTVVTYRRGLLRRRRTVALRHPGVRVPRSDGDPEPVRPLHPPEYVVRLATPGDRVNLDGMSTTRAGLVWRAVDERNRIERARGWPETQAGYYGTTSRAPAVPEDDPDGGRVDPREIEAEYREAVRALATELQRRGAAVSSARVCVREDRYVVVVHVAGEPGFHPGSGRVQRLRSRVRTGRWPRVLGQLPVHYEPEPLIRLL